MSILFCNPTLQRFRPKSWNSLCFVSLQHVFEISIGLGLGIGLGIGLGAKNEFWHRKRKFLFSVERNFVLRLLITDRPRRRFLTLKQSITWCSWWWRHNMAEARDPDWEMIAVVSVSTSICVMWPLSAFWNPLISASVHAIDLPLVSAHGYRLKREWTQLTSVWNQYCP